MALQTMAQVVKGEGSPRRQARRLRNEIARLKALPPVPFDLEEMERALLDSYLEELASLENEIEAGR